MNAIHVCFVSSRLFYPNFRERCLGGELGQYVVDRSGVRLGARHCWASSR